jgi:hypothetical protein
MRFFGIRTAPIPQQEREVFERLGVALIQSVLASGLGPAPEELRRIHYNIEAMRTHALDWLTEQYDRAERWETWSLTMEVVITVFVLGELTISIASWLYPHFGPRIGAYLRRVF